MLRPRGIARPLGDEKFSEHFRSSAVSWNDRSHIDGTIVPRCQVKQMSGKPQFDVEAVIAAAVGVFWCNGYGSAAISDLTEATGLSRSSIYQRFGDKDGLFQEALAAYTAMTVGFMRSVEGKTVRARLEAMLHAFKPDGSRPPGCLIARSCAEGAALSPEGRALAVEGAKRQREVIEEMLVEAIDAGELPANTDVDGLAWHYLGVLHAVLNLPQAGLAPEMLDRMIGVVMSHWPAPLSK